MRTRYAAAALSLTILGATVPASAQPYGGRDYGYDRRDEGYRDRDRGYDDRGRGDRYGFDEGEYLRCNPDVRRAVRNGQMESGAAHYRVFGRREGRRLSC